MAGWAAAASCGSTRMLKLALLLMAGMAGCGQGPAPAQPEKEVASTETHDVAVYVLSRGAGVPDATRAARDQARVLLRRLHEEKRALTLEETPIGLEGERRICATFSNAQDAADAAARLREIGAGVELFNIEMEPCARAAAPLPQQGEKP
jgi:hypothetical protein